jgi:hypothetical protein
LKNLPDDGSYAESAITLPASTGAGAPPPPPAPEDAQHAISDFLADKSDAARQKVFTEKILRAEDASRVLHLPQHAAQRLQTAARGAADAFLARWDNDARELVQSNIADASPDTVKQRLACIQVYQFNQNNQGENPPSKREAMFDQALKAELTPAQRAAWKVETDARKSYRTDAIAGWVACSFSQKFHLSSDQAARLEPMVANILTKYAGGIGSFFSSSNWYLENFYMYLPVAGIPDKDLHALLTQDQLDSWNRSQVHSIALSYWGNIAQGNN